MQSGYDAGTRHLGTPIDTQLREAIACAPKCLSENDHATKLFNALWLSPDLGMNEKAALFVKAPPVLQGMNLTNPPNGGFTTAARSVVVGAGPGGAEFNTRLSSTMFLQPGGPDKRVEVGPADAVQVSAQSPPYREPDGKTRSAHGHMTVARMDQEAAINAGRAAVLRDMYDPPLEPEPQMEVLPTPPPAPPVRQLSSPVNERPPFLTGIYGDDTVATALAVLEDTIAHGDASSGDVYGALATSTSTTTTTRLTAAGTGTAPGLPPMHKRLQDWWKAFLMAPMAPTTWTNNDQWVPVTILVLLAVLVVVACVLAATRK